ncbi:MAG: hypothetical protein ACLFUA_13175 [Spirochaetales bacterium]
MVAIPTAEITRSDSTRRSDRTRRASTVALVGLLALFLVVGTSVGAQETEDELFGGSILEGEDGESGDGQETAISDADFSDEMLSGEPVRIGGTYRFSLAPSFFWDELDSPSDVSGWPEYEFATTLGTQLFVDARPSSDFRVYAEADVSYPFTVSGTPGDTDAREFHDIVRITELFSDFTINDTLFLRGGKHTVTWGVGYFFSPADIINLERIDPEDPEADREGPVNVKAQLPISTTNLYLYALPPVGGEEYPAFAPRAEFVVDAFEIGFGGFWRPKDLPAGMVTVEGSISDFSLFAEAVVLGESDRTYVREAATPLGVETYTHDEIVFQGTAGLLYRYSDDDGDINLNAAGQYFYNGEGYEDSSVLSENQLGVLALGQAGELGASDLSEIGRHYAAASAGLSSILGSDISVQSLWYGNLSDASGSVSVTVSYRFNDYVSASTGANYTYGDSGDEFTPLGQRLGAELTVRFGSGSF